MIRLSKLMGERGLCSRREADRFIEAGLVLVDGVVVSTLGSKVAEEAQVTLLPAARRVQQAKITILVNKPLGVVSNLPEKGYPEAKELIIPGNQWIEQGRRGLDEDHWRKLAVAGRLDIDSTGLLVFTQDGALVKRLIGPESDMEKEYLVRVEGEVGPKEIAQLRHGLWLDGEALKPAGVQVLEPGFLRMVLRQGKKRQIRRMCELVGLHVTKLKRVRVGGVRLGKLPLGQWRYLEPDEAF